MSQIARTNLYLSQLYDLHTLQKRQGEGRNGVFSNSAILLIEQLLIAYMSEILETEIPVQSNQTFNTATQWLDENHSDTWLCKRLNVLKENPESWLYYWITQRSGLQGTVTPSVKSFSENLIHSTVDDSLDLDKWLACINELINEGRELNNYC